MLVRMLDLTDPSPFSFSCLRNESHSQVSSANLIKTCRAHRDNSQSSRLHLTRGAVDADARRLSRHNSTLLWNSGTVCGKYEILIQMNIQRHSYQKLDNVQLCETQV